MSPRGGLAGCRTQASLRRVSGLTQPTHPGAESRVSNAGSWSTYAGQVRVELRLQQVPYEHPDVASLEMAAQEFYVQIYGGPDDTPFTTTEFGPPHGAFFVGYLDGEAVAMGGWRFRTPGLPRVARRPAEIRRMFVRERV